MLHKVSYSDEALRKIKDTESAHEILHMESRDCL